MAARRSSAVHRESTVSLLTTHHSDHQLAAISPPSIPTGSSTSTASPRTVATARTNTELAAPAGLSLAAWMTSLDWAWLVSTTIGAAESLKLAGAFRLK